MTPNIGGVFCAGAFRNNMQADNPSLNFTGFSSWCQLAPDVLGRPYLALLTRIAASDHDSVPNSHGYRSEVQAIAAKCIWGIPVTNHWRFVIPPDWQPNGSTSNMVLTQIHDFNGNATGRRPTCAGEMQGYPDGEYFQIILSRDSVPNGEVIYKKRVVPGTEIELTIKANWADGYNVSDNLGYFELFDGDISVYRLLGRNTWLGDAAELYTPYIKAGIYNSGYAFPWWLGKANSVSHIAALVTDFSQTPKSCRDYVDGILSRYSTASVVSNLGG